MTQTWVRTLSVRIRAVGRKVIFGYWLCLCGIELLNSENHFKHKPIPPQIFSRGRILCFFIVICQNLTPHRKKAIKNQSHYKPGPAQRVPGGWGSKIFRQSANEGGKFFSLNPQPPLSAGNNPGTHISCGPGNSVGIATDYGLDGPGSNSGGDEIFRPSRPTLRPTHPPVKWVSVLSRVRAADHSPPF